MAIYYIVKLFVVSLYMPKYETFFMLLMAKIQILLIIKILN